MANDWLHANSIYYWPTDTFGGASNDIIWSSRHQDWVMKIDYENGSPSATGEILWRMGNGGDFTWVGPADPWPWFSHQHEVGIEDNGAGVMTVFDNGNTRISPPPIGLGGSPGCLPYDCNSRGMAADLHRVGAAHGLHGFDRLYGYGGPELGSGILLHGDGKRSIIVQRRLLLPAGHRAHPTTDHSGLLHGSGSRSGYGLA